VVIVTLDEDAFGPWAQERGVPADVVALARNPEVKRLIEAELDAANRRYAPPRCREGVS
jgi:hypothetical protein